MKQQTRAAVTDHTMAKSLQVGGCIIKASPKTTSSAPITIRVPFKLHKNGVRKLVTIKAATYAQDKAMVNALVRAHIWQKELDDGKYPSIKELALKYKVDFADASRLLNLNLLAPKVKKAILDGTQPRSLNLQKMKRPFPLLWEKQFLHFGF